LSLFRQSREGLRRCRPAGEVIMRPSKHIPLAQRRKFLIAALAAAGGLILGWLFPRRLAAVLFGPMATNDPQVEA